MSNKPNARTIDGRRQLWSELCKNIDKWLVMSTEELLKEAKKEFPAFNEETSRNTCLKALIANKSYKIIGE